MIQTLNPGTYLDKSTIIYLTRINGRLIIIEKLNIGKLYSFKIFNYIKKIIKNILFLVCVVLNLYTYMNMYNYNK